MAEYYDFRLCTVCRSAYICKSYTGPYDVTMWLNTMYLAVMQNLEKTAGSGLKSTRLERMLSDMKKAGECSIKRFDDSCDADSLKRYLRNGLAHFNILALTENGDISEIVIYALGTNKDEQEYGTLFDGANTIKNVICSFKFTIAGIKRVAEYVISNVLQAKTIPQCESCPLRSEKQAFAEIYMEKYIRYNGPQKELTK